MSIYSTTLHLYKDIIIYIKKKVVYYRIKSKQMQLGWNFESLFTIKNVIQKRLHHCHCTVSLLVLRTCITFSHFFFVNLGYPAGYELWPNRLILGDLTTGTNQIRLLVRKVRYFCRLATRMDNLCWEAFEPAILRVFMSGLNHPTIPL